MKNLSYCCSTNLHDCHLDDHFLNPNPQTLSILIDKLRNMKEMTKDCSAEIIRETSDIIKYVQDASNCGLAKLKRNEDKLDKMINSLTSIPDFKISPKLHCFLQMDPTEISEAHDFEFPILSISSSKLKSMTKGLFHVNSLFKKHVYTPKSLQIPVFRNFSKDLALLNLESKTVLTFSLEIPQSMSKSTCMCIVPGSGLFCFGNYADYSYTGLTFTINSYTSVKRLSEGTPCHCSGAAYMNGCVYVFGGYNQKGLLNLAERYTFATNSWSKLARLPEASDYCSCIQYGEKIIFSGNMHSKLFSYDPLLNSYDELFSLTSGRSKVLCGANSRLYIIESSGRIYESGIKDLRVWEHLWETAVIRFSPLSCVVTHNESIYFTLSNYKVYRFDLVKKNIEEHKEI